MYEYERFYTQKILMLPVSISLTSVGVKAEFTFDEAITIEKLGFIPTVALGAGDPATIQLREGTTVLGSLTIAPTATLNKNVEGAVTKKDTIKAGDTININVSDASTAGSGFVYIIYKSRLPIS